MDFILLSNTVPWSFPKYDGMIFFYLFLIVLAIFGYLKIMNALQSKQKVVFSYWNDFQKFAYARKCNQAEMNILHLFYDSLRPEEAELLLHPENRGKLKNSLYKYFLSAPENPTEKEVDLFDKLFRSSAEFKKEIQSIDDLTVGEVCAFEADGKEQLTYITQKKADELILSSKALSPEFLVPGKEAGLYVFRPASGGYLIHGVVTAVVEKAIVFQFGGSIERRGEAHLMLLAKYSLNISPWPPKDQGDGSDDADRDKLLLSEENLDKQFELLKRISKDQSSGKEHKFKFDETAKLNFSAISERVSDRGVTFEFPQGMSSDALKTQAMWEVNFSFPEGGPSITARGKIFPVKQKSNLYILRFVDAEEALTKTIFEELKKRGGTRELLS